MAGVSRPSGRPLRLTRARGFVLSGLFCLLVVLGLMAPVQSSENHAEMAMSPASNAEDGAATPGVLTGAQAFLLACAGCHSLEAGAPHGIGPNLHGLAGRPAGRVEGFAYSPALEAADLTWNAGTLTAWIVQTESVVPGTWMLYHNHLEPDEVTRLVDYLLAPR